jgi:hypothetical protein
MFWIGFTDDELAKMEPEEEGRVGLLVLGKHEERFAVHFWTWSQQQYTDHWNNALIRAVNGKPSALITDMRTPTQSSHLVWWPMWRIEDKIVFHNQLLIFERQGIHGPRLDTDYLYGFVGRRLRDSVDGTPLSEWTVAASDVEEFLSSSRPGKRGPGMASGPKTES